MRPRWGSSADRAHAKRHPRRFPRPSSTRAGADHRPKCDGEWGFWCGRNLPSHARRRRAPVLRGGDGPGAELGLPTPHAGRGPRLAEHPAGHTAGRRCSCLDALVVTHDHRGHGIGAAPLERFLDAARAAGDTRVALRPEPSDLEHCPEELLAFYGAAGVPGTVPRRGGSAPRWRCATPRPAPRARPRVGAGLPQHDQVALPDRREPRRHALALAVRRWRWRSPSPSSSI